MTPLHLREAGDGPPVVFLHGWSCHSGFFAEQMAALSDRFRSIAPDLPGHGGSEANEAALSIEGAARLVSDMLDARDLTQVTLVGWSMGAHVAYALLKQDRQARVGRLVVVDMTPKVLNDAAWRLGLRSRLDAERSARLTDAMRRDWASQVPHIAENMFAEGAPNRALRAYSEGEIARNDGSVMAAMWESLIAQDFRPLLPALRIPTVIAYGALSRIYSEEVARYQADAIPGARLVRFYRSGHSPHLEEAAAFSRMMRELR